METNNSNTNWWIHCFTIFHFKLFLNEHKEFIHCYRGQEVQWTWSMGSMMTHPFLMSCNNSSNFSKNVAYKIFNKEWYNRVFFVINTFQINRNNDIVVASDITWNFWNFGCYSDCRRITFWWRHYGWKVDQGRYKWCGNIDWDIKVTEIGLIGIFLKWAWFESGLTWKTYKRPRSGQTKGQFFLWAILANPLDSISGQIGLKRCHDFTQIRTFLETYVWGLLVPEAHRWTKLERAVARDALSSLTILITLALSITLPPKSQFITSSLFSESGKTL